MRVVYSVALFDLVMLLYTVPSILSIDILDKCTQYILCIFILGTVLIIRIKLVIIKYKNYEEVVIWHIAKRKKRP